MTTNHPAHGPVSLDRLHQISEILGKAAAQSDGGNLGYAMADAVKVIDVAIAAFGAEPVLYAAEETLAYAKMGELHLKCLSQPMGDAVIPLYTAPPSTVVPDEMTPVQASRTYGGEVRGYRDGWNACRAAMLQVGNSSSKCSLRDGIEAIRNSGIPVDVDKIQSECEAGNSPVTPDCSCRTCRPVTFTDSRFVVCHECGNKRCPHANDHRNACTGSNEPGQEGSAYPAEPQQEVKSALEHGMQRYAGAMQKLSEGDK